MSIHTPIYQGRLQSDLDTNGFNILGFSGGGGGGGVERKFDVKTYGAIGDGTTDDTAAIQAALAAIPAAGGVLYFPAGQYKYVGATLTLDRQITVEGDGGGVEASSLLDTGSLAISTIDSASATVSLFTVTANGCAFKNIELRNTSVTSPTAGAGIVVTAGGDRNLYENLTVNGFYIGVDVQSGWMQTFDNCYIVAPVLYGLKLRNVAMPDYGDHSISNCEILTARSRAATSAIRIESGGGVKVVNTKINSMAVMAYPWVNGIDLAVAAGVLTSDLLVSNCSIENYSGIGIKGTTGAGATWGNIVITGNQISPITSGGQYGINLSGAAASAFNGVVITGNLASTSASFNPMIALTNCSSVALTGNTQIGFSDYLTIGTGVTFAGAATYIGSDLRFVAITGGGKLQARNPGTNLWADVDQWTNP